MLYITTAVHNRKKVTKQFILNLQSQDYTGDWKLLLVDDGSSDGTDIMVKRLLPDAIIIYGNGNLWWGGSMQKAYEWLCANAKDNDIVLICNDDTDFPCSFIKAGVKHVIENRNILVTGTGYEKKSGLLKDGVRFIDEITGEVEQRGVNAIGNEGTTRALFLSVCLFKKIGGFHPILLPHYGSDTEFVYRAYIKGYPICSFDDLIYKYDGTLTGEEKKDLKTMFSKKSKYNPVYFLILLIMTTPAKYLPKRVIQKLAHALKQE